MSGAVATAFSAGGFVRSLVTSIMTTNTRAIIWQSTDDSGQPAIDPDTLQPINQSLPQYVAILEDHTDEMEITEHPVEQGATIADHAFKRPIKCTLQIGWSTSSAIASGLPTLGGILPIPSLAGFTGQGNTNFIQQVYQQLLNLQATRTLLTVYTGKRVLNNMLIQMLNERTTEHTENALIITATLHEIIIATVTTVQAPVNPTQSQQAQPEDTATFVDQGQQQATPAPSFNPSETVAT